MRRSSFVSAMGCGAVACGLPAMAAEPLPVRVGTLPIDPTAQPFFAANEGFFKAAGLDATVTIANNGSSLVAATASGAMDVIASSPAPLILAHQHGIPLKMIDPAAIYTGPAPNSALMVLQNSPLRSGADFNGKTIGVAGLHDMTQYGAQAWIDKNGGDSSTVRFIEIPYEEMAAALQQNRIDGAGIIEPFITGAKKTARIAGNLNDSIGHRYVLAGWCAEAGWLDKNVETARRFIAAMKLTAKWANGHHNDSAAILTQYTKITPEVAAVMARAHYDDSGRLDPATLQPVIDALVKYARLQPFPASDLIWTPPRR
jgi:NitT/TauT family transport system substrate-binding protein